MPSHHVIRPVDGLLNLCVRAFQKTGVSDADAHVAAEILIAADLRGVESHGVAHLRRSVDRLRTGVMVARPQERVLAETPATAAIDAGAGLGHPAAFRAMQRAIRKALDVGAGFVSVRNSNHFGIAGYYAMMALEHDCIGMAMTNASPKVVPTNGRNALLGTNPIAVAAPAGRERPFVLDMATAAVAVGKLEVADRLNKPLPIGWAIGKDGRPAQDAHRALDEFWRNAGGGLLPLGGDGELLGGHKGYGLALWVEIMSAVLAGSSFSALTYPKTPGGKPMPAGIGHFFGAWRIDAFRPADEFRSAMDELQLLLKNAPKAPGRDRIYIHGEKEFEAMERGRREGIALNAKISADLDALAQELGLDP